jgi:hypothetical protein
VPGVVSLAIGYKYSYLATVLASSQQLPTSLVTASRQSVSFLTMETVFHKRSPLIIRERDTACDLESLTPRRYHTFLVCQRLINRLCR